MKDFTMYFLGGVLAISMGVMAIIRYAWMNATQVDEKEMEKNIPLHHHETHTIHSEDLEDHKKVA